MYREMTQPHSSPLNNEVMRQNAPSVFAEAPRDDVSDRYGFIPTIQVVDALRDTGWMPVDATQKNVRKAGTEDFTKHLVRFRRLGDDIMVGDSAVELLLTNSHDRSSGFVLHAGMFRMACANGIVIADSTFQKVSVRHSLNAPDSVIEGSYEVIDQVPEIAGAVEGMRDIQLQPFERAVFAKTAFDYAFGDDAFSEEKENKIVTTEANVYQQLLSPRRHADNSEDLWTTYNVIQEHLVKGGVRLMRRGKKGIRRSKTRAIKSINKDIKLNKALWEMATSLQTYKQAA